MVCERNHEAPGRRERGGTDPKECLANLAASVGARGRFLCPVESRASTKAGEFDCLRLAAHHVVEALLYLLSQL